MLTTVTSAALLALAAWSLWPRDGWASAVALAVVVVLQPVVERRW